MKVVVAGGGKIGRHLCADLAIRGHDVALIEIADAAVAKAATEGSGVTVIRGDACAPPVLELAGVREADVVVAVTGDDEDNLVVSLLAKQEFAVPRVLARVNNPMNEWLFDDQWGVDVAVSPPHMLTALVEEEVSTGDLVSLLRLQHGQVELVEVRLDERSPAIGRRVNQLDLPSDVTLVAVVREEGNVTPCRGTTPLTAGDEVLALCRTGRQEELRARLVGR
ncbi:MAG: potassium channel family protein [Egibacteraceae bacterium]